METGMRIEFINRNHDVITFIALPNGTFIMQGGQHYRYGLLQPDNHNLFEFADPSGGPYIAKGMSLGFITLNWLGYIVRYLKVIDKKLIIVTYPDRIVKNIRNTEIVWKVYSPQGNPIEEYKTFEEAVQYIENKYDHDEFGQVAKIGD